MSKTDPDISTLYTIALESGRGIKLYKMLRETLNVYLRELGCITASIFRLHTGQNGDYNTEMIFSIPYALVTRDVFSRIEKLVPDHFTEPSLEAFRNSLPSKGKCEKNMFYHILGMSDFGFLVLIRENSFINEDILTNLIKINNKVTEASLNCTRYEELEESGMRYRYQQELLPQMMCETDREGVIMFANSYALDTMGYTSGELLAGIKINALVIPSDHNRLFANFAEALNSDISSPKEYTLIRKDGTTFPVLIYTNRLIKDKKTAGTISIIVDITDLKANELVLQQNLQQQEILSEISLELNLLDNFDKRINTVLSKIGQHTGVSRVYIFEDSPDGITTSNTFEWVNEGIRPQIDELQDIPYEIIPSWKKLLSEAGCVFSENIADLPEDLVKILEPQEIKSILVYPLYIRGLFFGFIGFDECKRFKKWSKSELELLRTVSGIIANTYERRNMEQSIIDERDKANSANKAKSEFLANMSHEIRTPMNAILGFSEALYHKTGSEQHKKMIRSILDSGNLLLSLLNDILDLSKIEAGKMEISVNPVDLNNILQEIGMLFGEKAVQKNIDFRIVTSDNFQNIVLIDEIRVKQILFNLVGNAVKFTQKGYVCIKAGFEIRTPGAGTLVLEVEDTGIGIPGSQQEIIFEAFSQQSGQSNRVYGGIGLGLAISRRLVEKMNGKISVSSKVGEGSVFKVVIPDVEIVNTEVIRKPSIEEPAKIAFKKAEILVIDDVPTNIETIENLLAGDELKVSSSGSGDIALEMLRHFTPDLILLDIKMPGTDGYETARQIKSIPRLSVIPVIAFTASVFSVDKIEHSGNFDGYLLKPARKADLISLLAKFLKHTKLPEDYREEEKDIKETDHFSREEIQRIPEVIEILNNEIMPRWESEKDRMILFRIEEIGLRLKAISEEYNIEILKDYSRSILEELEIVDLNSLKETLAQFPRLIQILSNIYKNEQD
jgi:PAS domain S-box-containing protein